MKIKMLWRLLPLILVLSSCGNGIKPPIKPTNSIKRNSGWQSQYDHIDPKDLPDNVIELFSEQWMVVTAGKENVFNSMVISWGGLGFIWEKPVAFTFINSSRYTYQFLLQESGYTLSVFSEKYRGSLRILGNKSGKSNDKVKEAGLIPIKTPSGLMAYKEARMIIECKNIMIQDLDYNKASPSYQIADMYKNSPNSHHNMFISEITNIWLKK
ncbi:flavin reductase [Sphingobacterium sp. 2149]|uniref:flavin reductase n=1 Tax=Sphingobacterium sp. 2149 TaxID=2817763 RepID=UPI00285ED7EC|nr:flavin reductase [Sphingobacterium sp. 2149]MDR6736611.1 flavin reductase (DIM6/NTAB) family NADH-FMN oxidoreductase RutF [Sphingobacterium sp. 2149]